ncbi:MAG: signal peptidase I [Planctomycetes bacterium]|nr:signal peptidase I [Planctomycetota bacterium]
MANAYFLQLGGRWAKIGKMTFLRAFGAIAAAEVVCWILWALFSRIPNAGLARTVFAGIILLILTLALTWLVIALILRTSLWRAAWAWLPTLVPRAGYFLLVLLTVKPYLIEAFVIPTNSMAPTIIGRHWEAPCPRCGSPAYSSVEPDWSDYDSHNRPVLMICSREHRTCEVADPPRVELPGDRLLVNKLLAPRRWDVIVFKMPEGTQTDYCKRLVGLPGETVVIRDGAVWIDGRRLSPPESCAGLEYLAEIKDYPEKLWGSPSKPARLGPDEYFVLGDFSARAKDSRLWQQGAPGHPPYAIPADYIIGVVTHIYWPLSRCRVLR